MEGILRQAFDLPRSHVHEIACLDPADAQWLVDFPLPVHAGGPASGSKRSGGRYGWSWAFVGWLRENCWRYDAIIVNGLWNFTTLGFVLAGRGRGTPYVVFTHGMLDPWFKATYPLKNMLKQLFWLFADGVVVNRASAVLFTSEEERRLARGAFRPYRARERVVAYGSGDAPDGAPAQLAAFRSVVPGLGERRYLLFLSRIHPKKGADLLIGAFARVAADEPGLDLVIAGPDQVGLRDTLHRQADRLGLSGRVHWPGMLQGDAKWGAFRGAEAFVLPSHQENFGIAVAEAMAAGTPVLISNKVNIWREVEAAGAGLVEEDSVEGIHRLLSGFLALAPDERRQMSKAARSAYERHFSADNGARELIAVLEDVIREKAG
ncbi:MAG: hypothetical protein JWQ89_1025 [Devosia sp.]|nr:hypothetical protein [Devosia sp.]